jgi:hypothetical protein
MAGNGKVVIKDPYLGYTAVRGQKRSPTTDMTNSRRKTA